jgi:hypothetical protein
VIEYSVEIIRAWGHEKVKATHRTTFEITKEDYLTERGDCIIAIRADKAPRDFSRKTLELLMDYNSYVLILISSGGLLDYVMARGGVTPRDEVRSIVRKSSFITPSTIAIRSNKGAKDLSRDLISEISRGGRVVISLLVFKIPSIPL